MASLPDESSEEFLPALKREYDRLMQEQSSAQSMHDYFKSMESRLLQLIEDKMGGLENTFKTMLADVSRIAGGAASSCRHSAASQLATTAAKWGTFGTDGCDSSGQPDESGKAYTICECRGHFINPSGLITLNG